MPKKKHQQTKPYCFVSYSSRESHVQALVPCLWIAFSPHFEIRLTPSALESGADQLSQIGELMEGCSFAIVVLDGLRPNVSYEFGMLAAQEKPLILLQEKNATVDIISLVGGASIAVSPPVLNLDAQFSNVKGIYHATWDKADSALTVKTLLQEYRKKKTKIKNYIEIEEPQLWS